MKTRTIGAALVPIFFIMLWQPVIAAEQGQALPPKEPEQKQQYEKTMQDRLSHVGKELDELKAKADTEAGKARKEVNEYFAEADKKGEKAFHELDSLRKATNEKWEQFKPRLNKAVDDFEKAITRAKDKLHHE